MQDKIKTLIKQAFPFVTSLNMLYWKLKQTAHNFCLSFRRRGFIFKNFYKKNKWGNSESRSGMGSTIESTRIIRQKLPVIIENYNVHTLLDAPCGDFNWMRHVNLASVNYIGADIVPDLIADNENKYSAGNVSFICMDICKDVLPDADMILCRDALAHLSNNDVFHFIKNLKQSNIAYLLSTTFTKRLVNADINTGQWRPINLCVEPFNFPEPELILNEEYRFQDGRYTDKSIGLWNTSEL